MADSSIMPSDPQDLGYSHDNLRHVVITATSIALALSTISLLLRLLCRYITKTKWFLDDYLMIVAVVSSSYAAKSFLAVLTHIGIWVFLYGISFAGVVLLYNGLGMHIQYVPPDDLTVYLKTLTSGTYLYTLCITFVKLSIVTLYKRLFPIKPMVMAVNIVGAIVIMWCFGVCLVGSLICIPLRKLWDPTVPGGCINLATFYYGLQIPNIVTDAVILVMPMRVVWDLQVPKMQKIMLSGIFMLGLLTLIFDVIRLVALIELSESGSDITYNQVPSSVWTCIEPAVGITAACLSNMRPLFKLITDRWPENWVLRRPSASLASSGSTSSSKKFKAMRGIQSTTVVEVQNHIYAAHGITAGNGPSVVSTTNEGALRTQQRQNFQQPRPISEISAISKF